MPSLELEFEVWCSCGEGLCNQTDTVNKSGRHGIIVTPCEMCLKKEYDQGFEDGEKSKEKEVRNGS